VAGIPDTYRLDANNIQPLNAEDYRASLQAYIDAVATTTARVIIVSYRSNGDWRPGGPVKFLVQSAVIVDTIFDSQRRRKPGVGE
jgi:hypothetical protein